MSPGSAGGRLLEGAAVLVLAAIVLATLEKELTSSPP